MRRLLLGLLCLCLSSVVWAAGPNAVRKRAEASLLVSGSIVVAADGSVSDCAIDQPDKLPAGVVDLVKKASASWRFEPVLVDGKPGIAKAKMNLRVVAKKQDGDNYAVSIRSAHFGDDDQPRALSYKNQSVFPKYPPDAIRNRVTGTVYLALRINPQGQVTDVEAEQVNLDVVANDAGMDRWRHMLADASREAAKQWTFNTPTSGRYAHADHWVARVPVSFTLSSVAHPPAHEYGKWDVYIPGPIQSIPWLDQKRNAPLGVDALPDGQLAQVGDELHLITPLAGS